MIAVYALVNVVTMALVVANLGWISIIALYITYFCMSIMFPTIFALGIKGLGSQTKQASSYLGIADTHGMQVGFLVPMVCFMIIFLFGFRGYRMRRPATATA